MIDVVKLLVDRPETEALMTEVYNFEETLAKVSPALIRLNALVKIHSFEKSIIFISNIYFLEEISLLLATLEIRG